MDQFTWDYLASVTKTDVGYNILMDIAARYKLSTVKLGG